MTMRTIISLTLCLALAGLVTLIAACETGDYRTAVAPKSEQFAGRDTEPGAPPSMRPMSDLSESPARDAKHAPLSVVSPGDELWVIAKPPTDAAPPMKLDSPATGALMTEQPIDPQQPDGQKHTVPLPLKHTNVAARVEAYIATVEVTQQFHNPYDGKIEAVYVFPLPQDAAVSEFIMTIGDRKIRGVIREKAEAERIYHEARRQGFRAALLTQQRPNIFTQKVANIEPGKQIDINIKYFNTLAYADGWYTFVFPMVVGPRFNPPHTAAAGEGVGAVPRGRQGTSGQGTEVQYLKPTERSSHDIALSLELNPGVTIEELRCTSHRIVHSPLNEDNVKISIAPDDTIPNKDFVLSYRIAGDRIKSNLLVHRDSRGGFFTLMLYPPRELQHLPRRPMEMVFVLDCSGSMNGYPIEKSKAAIRHALSQMVEGDTFQVIQFSNSASALGPNPVPVTEANVRRAMKYVDSLRGSGGTMMIEGIKAALDFPQSQGRQRVVAFLTDGYIGNETEILGAIHDRLRNARIFSFGVGSSVNRYLMERMAKLGRGAVAYVGPRDDEKEIIDHFFDRISRPALADIEIDWGSMSVSGVFPKRVPDLFVGRPVLMVGRFDGDTPQSITLRGNAANETVAIRVEVETTSPHAAPGTLPGVNGGAVGGIPAVWARIQIADLMDQLTHTRDPHEELVNQIRQLALDFSLMSNYTAFIAVDSSAKTAGDHGTTVPVPVPVPEGVRYDTTVGKDGG